MNLIASITGMLMLTICVETISFGMDKEHKTEQVDGRFTLIQLGENEWSATWHLEQPIQQIMLDRQLWDYQRNAWKITTPNVELIPCKDNPELGCLGRTDNKPWSQLEISVTPWYKMPNADYYAFSPFSDGGMAIFAGYFAGQAIIDEELLPMNLQANFGKNALPNNLKELGHHFIFYGESRPVKENGNFLVIDPAIPEVASESIRNAIPQASETLENLFKEKLPVSVSILLAAGHLDSYKGYSRKGGALAEQIVFTFKGQDLKEELENQPSNISSMVVHELGHVWQFNFWPRIGEQNPWVHEGMATFLEDTLLGDSEKLPARREIRKTKCVERLAKSSIRDAYKNALYDMPYHCGAMIYDLVFSAHLKANGGDSFWPMLISLPEEIRNLEGEELMMQAFSRIGLSTNGLQAITKFLELKPDEPDVEIAKLQSRILLD